MKSKVDQQNNATIKQHNETPDHLNFPKEHDFHRDNTVKI